MSDTNKEREAFEKDAGPYGFDLLRDYGKTSGEPWAEYLDDSTGHRWGGWLAHAQQEILIRTGDDKIDDIIEAAWAHDSDKLAVAITPQPETPAPLRGETYAQWRDALSREDIYNFDSEGRGYKKDSGDLMRMAFEAGQRLAAPMPQSAGVTDERIRAIANECGMFSDYYENAPGEHCDRFARAVLALAQGIAPHQPQPEPTSKGEALERMLPIFEKLLKDAVFTGDTAGQVIADMNTLRASQQREPQEAVEVKYVPVDASKRNDNDCHPNDDEPCTTECLKALNARGDDTGQGLDNFWKWGFKAGFNAALSAPQEAGKAETQLLDEWASACGRVSSLTSGLRSDLLQLIRSARASKEAGKVEAAADERVYLVATGETHEGQETYTRHEVCPPMCDAETLYLRPSQQALGEDAKDAARWRFTRDHNLTWFVPTKHWRVTDSAGRTIHEGRAETYEQAVDSAILAAAGGSEK